LNDTGGAWPNILFFRVSGRWDWSLIARCAALHYVCRLGYQYDGLIGLPGSQPFQAVFRVNPVAFRRRLAALLQS
jgi:hypothetical protein